MKTPEEEFSDFTTTLADVVADTIFGDLHLLYRGRKFAWISSKGVHVWTPAEEINTAASGTVAVPYVPVPGSEATWRGWAKVPTAHRAVWKEAIRSAYERTRRELTSPPAEVTRKL